MLASCKLHGLDRAQGIYSSRDKVWKTTSK